MENFLLPVGERESFGNSSRLQQRLGTFQEDNDAGFLPGFVVQLLEGTVDEKLKLVTALNLERESGKWFGVGLVLLGQEGCDIPDSLSNFRGQFKE